VISSSQVLGQSIQLHQVKAIMFIVSSDTYPIPKASHTFAPIVAAELISTAD